MRSNGVFVVLAAVAAVAAVGGMAACSRPSEAGKPGGVPPLAAPSAVAPAPVPAPLPEPEAIPGPPDERQTISGTIVLPASQRAKVARGDVMFLAARRAGGPPGPASMLAVQKLVAADFPMPFAISNRDAMIPGIPFEGPVSITVRVDKDGDAMTRRKGDVFGQANDVEVGRHDVVVKLDSIQSEDRTLGPLPEPRIGQGESQRQGLPPGHP